MSRRDPALSRNAGLAAGRAARKLRNARPPRARPAVLVALGAGAALAGLVSAGPTAHTVQPEKAGRIWMGGYAPSD